MPVATPKIRYPDPYNVAEAAIAITGALSSAQTAITNAASPTVIQKAGQPIGVNAVKSAIAVVADTTAFWRTWYPHGLGTDWDQAGDFGFSPTRNQVDTLKCVRRCSA